MPHYPKFEHNIKDQYTITQNNSVGAENRGDVYIKGSNPLDITSIPVTLGGNSCTNLKEIIAYADSNSNDAINFNLNVDIDETHFNIPDRMVLQSADDRFVTINLIDFEKARYDYKDITVGAVGGCVKSDTPNQYSPACADEDTLYYLKEDGSFDTLIRSNINGKTYLAVDSDADFIANEYSLVDSAGTIQLYNGNNLILTDLTGLDTTNPKIRHLDKVPDNGYLGFTTLIKTTTVGEIFLRNSTGGTKTVIIQQPDESKFNAEYWDSDSGYGIAYDVATAKVNGAWVSHLYKSDGNDWYKDTCYQASALIKTINSKLLTLFLVYRQGTTNKYDAYVGGSQVWYYNDTTWKLQLSLTFEPDNAKFIRAGNILYFVVGNTTTGRLEIYKKNLNNPSSTWQLVRRYFNKCMLYLSHYYDSSTFGLRILFKNTVDNKLYYFINKTITLTNRVHINGLIIKNNASFYDLGQDEFGNEIFMTPIINGTTTGGLITYCSLYANDLNILNWTWMVQNSILKSNKNGLYYKGSSSPAYEEEFKNNLILCGGWAVKLEKSTGTPSFSNAVFKNNTIKSANGMSLCVVSGLTNNNNIIDCSYTAFDINSTTNTLTVSNSIVNGQVDDQVTLSNCLEATNPLFKDIYNDDYTLMSKAEGYPKDSKAIKYGDDGKNAGCYDFTRTNNGETLKETFELTGFVADIIRSWEYPKKEVGFDYRGNFLKTMSNGTRLIKLNDQWGNMNIEKIDYLEYLISRDEPMRFYPYGDNGIPFVIDYTIPTEQVFNTSATLNCNFTTMIATVPANYKFQRGFLKGAWLIVNTTKWYYIKDNTETTLYLENKENFTNPANGSYSCSIKWFYVKTSDNIEYNNGIWTNTNQEGIFPSLTLYVVESKDV